MALKKLRPLLFLVGMLPLAVFAQPNEQQMQQMMQRAAEMQACFAKVDQSKLEALAEKAKKMQQDVKALCASGKRGAAQEQAIKFGMEISNSSEMKVLRQCGEIVREMLPPVLFESNPDQFDDENNHVCNDI